MIHSDLSMLQWLGKLLLRTSNFIIWKSTEIELIVKGSWKVRLSAYLLPDDVSYSQSLSDDLVIFYDDAVGV